MKNIHKVHNLLRLAFYRLIMIMMPQVSNAGPLPIDRPTETYQNWAYCLAYQYHQIGKNKLADNIAEAGCKWGKWITFSNKILAISLKVGSWESPEEIFASQDFIAMYRHPAYYWRHAVDYLASPEHKEAYKKIAIYGLENLGYADYLSFAEACYKLYQNKHLSEPLFEMVLGFEFLRIHPLVMGATIKGHYEKSAIKSFLTKVQSEIREDSPIKLLITEMLSGRLANAWRKKRKSAYLHYKDPLPFADIIHKAHKEATVVLSKDIGLEHYQHCPYQPPYFLMIYDHPSYYSAESIRHGSSRYAGYPQPDGCIESFLTDSSYPIAEKKLAIFAMQQLDSQGYARLIKKICSLYNWHPSLLYIMQDLIYCSIGRLFHKYPFFILDHKVNEVQQALDKLLAIPSLTCGIHFMTKKIKRGSLATPREMDRMQFDVQLHKTRFRLYETIGPLKCVVH